MGPKINLIQNSCKKIIFDVTLGDAVIKSVTVNGEELQFSSKYTIRSLVGVTHTIVVTDFNDEKDIMNITMKVRIQQNMNRYFLNKFTNTN